MHEQKQQLLHHHSSTNCTGRHDHRYAPHNRVHYLQGKLDHNRRKVCLKNSLPHNTILFVAERKAGSWDKDNHHLCLFRVLPFSSNNSFGSFIFPDRFLHGCSEKLLPLWSSGSCGGKMQSRIFRKILTSTTRDNTLHHCCILAYHHTAISHQLQWS